MTPWTAAHRLPCPSLSPEVCSNSCPPSWWCHPNISSSVTPSPLSLNLFWHQSLFQRVGSLYQVAKVLELKLQHHSFQWIFRVDFLKDWLVWSPCSPRYFQESSPTPQFKLASPWNLTPATPPSWSLWTWVSCSGRKSERVWTLQLEHQNHLKDCYST